MSAYRKILYHIVFRTKCSEKTINQNHSTELKKYIWGIIRNKKCVLYRINGMEDHIHILSDLHPSIALADYIKEIKVASSKWMKESGLFPNFRGCVVFIASPNKRSAVRGYYQLIAFGDLVISMFYLIKEIFY